MVMNIIIGIVSGIFSAFMGYVKNIPYTEEVDFWKAMPIICLGGISGLVASYYGVTINNAMGILGTMGVIHLMNNICILIKKLYMNKSEYGRWVIVEKKRYVKK